MRVLIFTTFFAFLTCISLETQCQNDWNIPDAAYGLDPLLYNGTLYTYVSPPGTDGSPFFHKSGYVNGSVKLRGENYEHLSLKYDLYHQQLILKYSISVFQIALSNAWLEAFDLDGMHFEVMAIEDTIRRNYQVIGNGQNKILFYYHKELALDIRLSTTNYLFSEIRRDAYIYNGALLLKFKNNRSFIALYPRNYHSSLKKFMRQNKINVKKSDEPSMTTLINFCNTLKVL